MMTTEEKNAAEEFIERIEALENGALAQLRRGCGARDTVEGRCPWMLGLVRTPHREAPAFLVASLLAQYKTSDIRAGRHRMEGDFGVTWREAIAHTESKSIVRRFHILLDADYDPGNGDGDLPYRLRQMVRYAASRGVGVHWPLLFFHIHRWNDLGKWVQKTWARSFFGNEIPEGATQTTEEGE